MRAETVAATMPDHRIAAELRRTQPRTTNIVEERNPYVDARYSKVIHYANNASPAAEWGRMPALSYGTVAAAPAVFGGNQSVADIEEADDELCGFDTRYAYRFVKRAFDISLSLFALIALSWLYLIVALAVKLDDISAPVLFKQTRIGKDGHPFEMYKFRTMCVDAEEKLDELKDQNEKTGPVFKMADDPRITRVGKWLRKFSLDELPQFFNVLRGDMSVIGPRPALPKEVLTYTSYQRQRLLVPAGITCYWQTQRNRDSITFDEWVDLDLLYIKECGVLTDVKIVVKTILVMLTAQGS